MRLDLICIGRLKAGPERDLLRRYLERCASLGRQSGISSVTIEEIAESRARHATQRMAEEARAIANSLGDATCAVLDERGENLDSAAFAGLLGRQVDAGLKRYALVIGGPDGLDAGFRRGADSRIAFGRMTLPHQLVRVLLAEQVYRAMTIRTGHPYHRA
jgi:23S rRNA (pseudouridine1915-N3)-methyltransferase